MTLKQKLVVNMTLTALGIVIIAGFSLSGMRFVQNKLHVLTEQSTPYQLKVYEQQRALQEHIGNLLRFSVATTSQELVTTRQNAEKTLVAVERVTTELAAFKGETNLSDSQMTTLREITREIESASSARIAAFDEVQKALRQIDVSLERIGSSLKGVDRTMKGTQQKMVRDIASANDSFKRSSARIKAVQQALGHLNDIKLALTELSAAEASEEVASIRSRLDGAVKALGASTVLKVEKGTKSIRELADSLADFGKNYPVLCDAVSASLDPRDEVKRARALADISKSMKVVNRHIRALGETIEASNQAAASDGKHLDETLANSVAVSAQLAKNGDLVSLGAEVKARVRDMFTARNQAELDQTKGDINALLARADSLRQGLRGVAGIDAVAANFSAINGALFGQNGAYERLTNIVKVTAQATASAERLKGIVAEQRSLGDSGVEKAKTAQALAITSVTAMFRSSIILVVSIGAAVLALAMFSSRHLLKSVMRPIGDLEQFAAQFGNGDFSTRLDAQRKDEFGVLAADFNGSSETLSEIVVELTGAIKKMVGSVTDLTSAVTTIDRAVDMQASLAQGSATAIEQMSATVSDVARTAVNTSELTAQSQRTARAGHQAVAETVTAMTGIAAAVSTAATVMTRLAESSERVGGVVGVINEIADQTNLLALNAAIEAARAGEQGKGFAVVADEVRALATRTTEATKEIANMIGVIQSDINSTQKAMNEGRKQVDVGVTLAGGAQKSLNEIVTVCDSASQMVAQIATATEEQAATATEVSSGVVKMSEMSEQTRAAAGQISAATAELEKLAAELGRRASWFKSGSGATV